MIIMSANSLSWFRDANWGLEWGFG